LVAGVPPDYFSAKGQLWDNPVYDWKAIHHSNYRWCIDRLELLLAHMDLIRLDHFRAFCAAWHVSPTAQTAEPGHWVLGPGTAFFEAVRTELGHLPFIAEDLGIITPDVVVLRDKLEWPGIRVFQFGFDGRSDNPHLPTITSRTRPPARGRTTIPPLAPGLNLCRKMFARLPGVMR
jgi:4-alpha-glucanotransferase